MTTEPHVTTSIPTPSPAPTPVPSPTSKHQKPRRFSVWRFAIGAVVVLFGAQLLANNYGWHWTVAFEVWKLWPIIIILIGLSIFLRGHTGAGLMGFLVTLVFIGFCSLVLMQTSSPSHAMTTSTFSEQKIDGAVTAAVTLKLGAVSVDLQGGSAEVISGTYRSAGGSFSGMSTLSGEQQETTYTTTNGTPGWWFGGLHNDLHMRLTNDIPVTLSLDTGAADLTADLSSVQLADATIKSGASSLNITLGDLVDTSSVSIDAGASSIDITLPSTLGVTLHLDTGASSKTVPRFTKQSDGTYVSDGAGDHNKKLELRVTTGASNIDIHWK